MDYTVNGDLNDEEINKEKYKKLKKKYGQLVQVYISP